LICVIIGYLSHYWGGGGSKDICLKEQNAEIKCNFLNKNVIFLVLSDCQGGICIFEVEEEYLSMNK
jgi:hypothetical protein